MQGVRGGFPHRRSHLQGKKGEKTPTKIFLMRIVGQTPELSSTFLHFKFCALNSIALADFTYCFYCALLLCLNKSTCLAQTKHLHGGNGHSGLNAYTVIMKTDRGKKLSQLMVTFLLISHYAPGASRMHLISSDVSVLSLDLKLLG